MHIPSLIISDWSFELFTGASSFKHTKLVMVTHGGQDNCSGLECETLPTSCP